MYKMGNSESYLLDSHTYTLRAADWSYVADDKRAGFMASFSRNQETYFTVDYETKDTVSLKLSNGKYLCSDDKSSGVVQSKTLTAQCIFKVEYYEGRVAFRTQYNTVLISRDGNIAHVGNGPDFIEETCLFTFSEVNYPIGNIGPLDDASI